MITSPFPPMLKALPPVMTDRISGPTQENTKVFAKSLYKDLKNHKTKFFLPLVRQFPYGIFFWGIHAKMAFNRSQI